MRLAVVTADIRNWNGEHREQGDKREPSQPEKAAEYTQVDDGGAAFVWALIARVFRALKTRN
jgi:hypothetical protein